MKRIFALIAAIFITTVCNAVCLNFMRPGDDAPTQIAMDTTARSTPSFVALLNGVEYRANLTPVAQASNVTSELIVKYNARDYVVQNNIAPAAFWATTTENTTSFEFSIAAQGVFLVDWGDGTPPQLICKDDVSVSLVSHTYAVPGKYTIGIGGRATKHSARTNVSTISFADNLNLGGISGSLGAVFPTIGDASKEWQQPRFYYTFSGCTNLTGLIPENLFDGLYGQPGTQMFDSLFYRCSGLTGSIPEKLFAELRGHPTHSLFENTFRYCSGLTGSIPEKLFAGMQGAPAYDMFAYTFSGCRGLNGEIPKKLFAGISGAPAEYMYDATFFNCSNLSGSIPPNLFGKISGEAKQAMYAQTFYGCKNLTGTIPDGLFGDIYGPPGKNMFHYTFDGCSSLSGGTARNIDGTRIYDIMYDGKTWYEQCPECFDDMYLDSGIVEEE